MNSIILKTASRYLIPLMLLFSVFLLLRGHNEPGGGFVGGLVAALAYALFSLGFDIETAKEELFIDPIYLVASGLSIVLLSGIVPLFTGQNFLTGIWWEQHFPIIGKAGTPFFFDVGVYLVVMGISLKIIFTLREGE